MSHRDFLEGFWNRGSLTLKMVSEFMVYFTIIYEHDMHQSKLLVKVDEILTNVNAGIFYFC